MNTKIKICGITNVEDAKFALSLGVDFLGLIFVDSPRRVTRETAREIRRAIPDTMLVGVFMDSPIGEVADIAVTCGLNFIQLHGDESPEYCDELRTITGTPIIKAFRASDMPTIDTLGAYETTSYFLFDLDKDMPADETSEMIADLWKQASKRRRQGFRMFLAGALDATNVREAIEKTEAYCVDVCRGVEESPGVKDRDALEHFIAEVRR
jgi:phosphoribosylanthranilate isomerase